MTTQTFSTTQNKATTFFPALWQLILAEFRRLIREPMFAVGTLVFPLFLFMLFGLSNINKTAPDGTPMGPYLIIGFGASALLSLAFFSFGVTVATERKGSWLQLLRASPMPSVLYFVAKLIAAMLFSAIALILQYAFAYFVGGVTMSLAVALTALSKLLLGMIPLVMFGLALGFLASPNAANVFANIMGLVLAFGSGLYIPLFTMPKIVQQLAPYSPAYHLGEVGRSAIMPTTYPEIQHWLVLLGFTLFFGILAWWGWKNDESRA